MSGPWEKYQQPTASGNSDSGSKPWEKYGNPSPQAESDDSLSHKAWEGTKSALGYGLRALDYAGGLSRTAVAGAAGGIKAAAGGEQPVTMDDVGRAFKGQAPSSSEYLDKFGVPEGAKMHVPVLGDVSARGAAGLVGDVALDPLTYLSLGSSAAEKVAASKAAQIAGATAKPSAVEELKALGQKLMRPVSDNLEKKGDAAYKSAFKVPDAKLDALGVDPVSEVMFNNGRPAGSAKTLQDAVDELSFKKTAERKAIYDQVNTAGGKVDLLKAVQPSLDKAKEIMRVDPNATGQVAGMKDWLSAYMKDGQHIPVDLASDYKTRINKAVLPANSYNALTGRALPVASDMQKSFAQGLRSEIMDASERAIPGTGEQIRGINDELAPLLEVRKRIMPTEVRKDATKNMFTAVDGGIAGLTSGNPAQSITGLAMKKAADLWNTPYGRTHIGNLLSDTGKTGIVDSLIRRGAIDANHDQPSNPWDKVR